MAIVLERVAGYYVDIGFCESIGWVKLVLKMHFNALQRQPNVFPLGSQ